MSLSTSSDTLSIPEAAARFGISTNTAYRVAQATGELAGVPVLRFGRTMRLSRQQVDAVLAPAPVAPTLELVGG